MKFSNFFIERPIFATVLSLLLLVAGGVCVVAAAAEAFGRAAALGAAGLWLTVLAYVIARAKGGNM